MSLYNACVDLLDGNISAGRGGKLAYADPARKLTYGGLQEETFRFANLLRRLGIRREERILMIMTDTVEFPIVFLGALRAGSVPVPCNTLLSAEQYAYMLADSRAQALFVSADLWPAVAPALEGFKNLPPIVMVGGQASAGMLDFATKSPSGSIHRVRRAPRRAHGMSIRACAPRRAFSAKASWDCMKTISSIRPPNCFLRTGSAMRCRFRSRSAPAWS
jgi:acyl-CoA synthetase (AMP-forming)/AMP-acid ligase II